MCAWRLTSKSFWMDSRKCQTAAASPAKPGELPIGLGPDATVVTILCDTGMKYLKTYGAVLNQA